MRSALFLALFCFPASVVFASFAVQQNGVNNNNTTANATTVTCTFGGNPVAGDLVACGVEFYDATSIAPTFTAQDANNNVYTVDSYYASAQMSTAGETGQAYLLSAPSNANKAVTFTFSKSSGSSGNQVLDCWCDDFTVTGAAAVYDSGNTANGTAVASASNAPTITVTGSSDLVYCTEGNSNNTSGVAAPFSENHAGIISGNLAEYATGQSSNVGCQFTYNGNNKYDIVGMSFKQGSVGGLYVQGGLTVYGGLTVQSH